MTQASLKVSSIVMFIPVKKPLPDPDIIELINSLLKLVERAPTRKRVLDRVVEYVNTYIHGIAA